MIPKISVFRTIIYFPFLILVTALYLYIFGTEIKNNSYGELLTRVTQLLLIFLLFPIVTIKQVFVLKSNQSKKFKIIYLAPFILISIIAKIWLLSYLGATGDFMSNLAPFIFSAVVLVPIAEEIYFRGILFNLLRSKLHIGVALIISSVLFALVHPNLVALTFTFYNGLLFGYIYYKSGRLLYSIALHALFNLIPILVNILMYFF